MVRAILISALVLALFGTATVQSTPASAAEGDLPTLTGLSSADRDVDLDRLQSAVGRYPSLSQLFWTVEADWPNGWAPRQLDLLHERGVVAVVEITVDSLNALN